MAEMTAESMLDHQLTVILALYLSRHWHEACVISEKWADVSWVARCVAFLCYSFFLYEPTKAVEMFGGIEQLQAMMESECVERYFLKGHGALIRGNWSLALSAFQRANSLLPQDPYISLSLAVAHSEEGRRRKAKEIFDKLKVSHPDHPLLRIFQFQDSDDG
jgi:hypothetical protein